MGLLDGQGLAGLLAAGERNHAIIANNMANLSTPGYRTARLQFAKQLDSLLDARANLLPGQEVETRISRPMFDTLRPDGNDVTLAREILELNKNALRMQLYLAVLGGRVRKLRAAIDGR
jgi:flagellar basal-body rod protein FlgB